MIRSGVAPKVLLAAHWQWCTYGHTSPDHHITVHRCNALFDNSHIPILSCLGIQCKQFYAPMLIFEEKRNAQQSDAVQEAGIIGMVVKHSVAVYLLGTSCVASSVVKRRSGFQSTH